MKDLKSLIDVFQTNSLNQKQGKVVFINGENDEKHITYKELYFESLKILYNLQSLGLKRHDELMFQINKNEEFIPVFWACILGGIIPVPVTVGNTEEHKQKIFRIWSILRHPSLITCPNIMDSIEKFAAKNDLTREISEIKSKTILIENITKSVGVGKIHEATLNDIAFIQFSSGSTGEPKGVVLTHENLLVNSSAIINGIKLSSNESALGWMPLTHDMGLIGFHIVPVLGNIDHYLMPTPLFIGSPTLWIKKAQEHKINILASPNFGYKHFLKFYNPQVARNWDLSHIRIIFNGAEPISVGLAQEFLNTMERHGLNKSVMLCVYGLAEASLVVSFPHVGEPINCVRLDRKSLSLGNRIKEIDIDNKNEGILLVDEGFAVDGCKIKILGKEKEELEASTVGRIFIKGKNVTSEFYNNKEYTQKVITSDGWLDTGDLGFLKNNRLVITGREKDIIFLNGQNFYPYDIERIVHEVEGFEINEVAACGVFNSKKERDEVILFIVFKEKIEQFVHLSIRLKKFISKQIGLKIDYLLPISHIPKTTSGKIQRFKLGEMYQNGEYDYLLNEMNNVAKEKNIKDEVYDYPDNIVKSLLNIWGKVLELEHINLDDNFFELGGDSLKATLIISLIHKEINVKIPIKAFFDIQTIGQMAEYVVRMEREQFTGVKQADKKEYYSLSSAQKRFYILNQMNSNDLRYNMPYFMDVEGHLDIGKVEHIFKQLIDRHESLRTSFATVNGEPVQIISENVNLKCEFYECKETEIDDIINLFIRKFDLIKAPLFRLGIINIHNKRCILMIDMHHIITDGVSMNILAKEFMLLYEGKELPELSIQYKDFSEWQNEIFKSGIIKKQEEYWLRVFSGNIPNLNMPTDHPRDSIKTFKGNAIYYNLDKELSCKIKRFIANSRITLNVFLLGTYNILLSKYTGQDDIIIGSLTTGRNHIDLQNTVGLFFNTLAIRNMPKGEKKFVDFLEEVKSNAILAFENQDYQFNELVWKLGIKAEYGKNPLFDTLFTMQNIGLPSLDIPGLKVKTLDFKNYSSKFDLYFDCFESEDTITILMKYLTEIYEKSTIETILQHFSEVISQVIDNKEIKLGDIRISHDLVDIKTNMFQTDQCDFMFEEGDFEFDEQS